MRLFQTLGRSGAAGIGVFVALAIATMLVPLSLGSSSLGSSSQQRMIETSKITASALHAELGNLSASVRATGAELSETQAFDEAYVDRRITALRSSHPAIRTAAFIDLNGNVIASDGAAVRVGTNYSDRPYFTGAMTSRGDVFISNPFVSTLAGNVTAITASVVVTDTRTDSSELPVRGVLMAALDVAATLQPVVANFATDDGAEVAVYDREARRIVGSSEPVTDTSLLNQLKELRSSRNWTSPAAPFTSDSGKVLFALAAVPDTGFVVVSSAMKDSVFAPMHDFKSKMLYMVLFTALGTIVGLWLVTRSMSRRNQALDDLRNASERTEQILETAAEAFVECDDRGRVIYWNGAAASLFGYAATAVVGQDLALLVVSDGSREVFREQFRDAMNNSAGTTPTKRELLFVRNGENEAFSAEVIAWTIRSHGVRTRCMLIEDVSARVQLETAQRLVMDRQRELVEELRSADQAKSDFMSTVSHELRTPLTSIVGYVEMLHDGYGGDLDKSAMSMIDVIDRNSQRLLAMIEDLLMLSRIESGYDKPEIRLVDIGELVGAVADALVPQTRDHQLSLDVDVADGLPLVNGDENQLERVILNVMSNAVKFTPDGGQVSLQASSLNGGKEICIRVTDTGIGIPLSEQSKLFSRFFRSTNARTNAIQGTGLGLAIVKGIVDRHHGKVSLQSEPGVGTTIEIVLPAAVRESISADA